MMRINSPSSPITKYFESANQTITAGGTLSLAHGLGTTPIIVQPYLVMGAVVELNYDEGDEYLMLNSGDDASAGRGIAIVPGSTSIFVRFGSAANSVMVLDKNTGNISTIANARWTLKIRAFA